MISRRLMPLGAALVVGACSPQPIELTLSRPHLGGLELSGLSAEVVVKRDGAEFTTATLSVSDSVGTVRVPELPAGFAYDFELVWSAEGIEIATTEAKTVRVEAGATAELEFSAADYSYPDDDDDGVPNLFEVHALGAAGAQDPESVPNGFFNDFDAMYPLPAYPISASVRFDAPHLVTLTAVMEQDSITNLQVFADRALHVIDLSTGERSSTPLGCLRDGMLSVPNLDYGGWSANIIVSCSDRALLYHIGFDIDLKASFRVGNEIEAGQVIMMADFTRRDTQIILSLIDRIEVRDSIDLSVIGSLTTAESSMAATLFNAIVDTGERFIVTPGMGGGLAAINHTNGSDLSYAGVGLEADIPTPVDVALHPLLPRAYVTDSETGNISVVDISSDDASEWSLIAQVPIAPGLLMLAIEPVSGGWLYALWPFGLVRVNTLTHEIDWRYALEGEATESALMDVSLSEGGQRGAVALIGKAIWSMRYTPGNPREGYHANNYHATTVTLGPALDWVTGFVEPDRFGIVDGEYYLSESWIYEDDIEEYFALDVTSDTGLFALALVPAFTGLGTTISLIDGEGNILAEGVWGGGADFAAGTGTLLVSPPNLDPAGDYYAAVGAFDLDDVGTPYVAYFVPLGALPTWNEANEVEEFGDTIADAELAFDYPMQILGRAEKSDTGGTVFGNDPGPGQDTEDCFLVSPKAAHLALRLEPIPPAGAGDPCSVASPCSGDLDCVDSICEPVPGFPADLHLIIFDNVGERLADQYYYFDRHLVESWIFEPRQFGGTAGVVACVAIDDDATLDEVDYALTLIDLSR